MLGGNNMNQNEFMREQQAAVERMREMNSRAQINHNTSHKMPPVPSFVRLNENTNTNSKKINDEPKKETQLPRPLQTQQNNNKRHRVDFYAFFSPTPIYCQKYNKKHPKNTITPSNLKYTIQQPSSNPHPTLTTSPKIQ